MAKGIELARVYYPYASKITGIRSDLYDAMQDYLKQVQDDMTEIMHKTVICTTRNGEKLQGELAGAYLNERSCFVYLKVLDHKKQLGYSLNIEQIEDFEVLD